MERVSGVVRRGKVGESERGVESREKILGEVRKGDVGEVDVRESERRRM